MNRASLITIAAISLVLPEVDAQISIPTVVVGDPGNPSAEFFPNPGVFVGGVSYTYHIGTHEVTNAQYAAFLNAKAASDPHGLFNPGMQIMRSGADGAFTYAAAAGSENRPVFLVGFWDAARFCNWMTNGQGDGDTEAGVYDLNPEAVEANTVTRDFDAWAAGGVAIASANEWIKAAFYQPADDGGDEDGYWNYAIAANEIDTSRANYAGSVGATTPVGSYPDDPSYYGTFDQNGNVEEWTDGPAGLSTRLARGGHYGTTLTGRLGPGYAADYDPNHPIGFFEFETLGFRVTSPDAIGNGGGSERGPVRLVIRRDEPGSVVLEVSGQAGDDWMLMFSAVSPAGPGELKTSLTLGDDPFQFPDTIDAGGRGYYWIEEPVAP